MRRSFDGLAAIAQNVLSVPAASGDWFVFINRRRTQMKILYFDTGGYCIWAKRLERGRFQLPQTGEDIVVAEVDAMTLAMMLGGVDLDSAKRRKRYQPIAPVTSRADTSVAQSVEDDCLQLTN